MGDLVKAFEGAALPAAVNAGDARILDLWLRQSDSQATRRAYRSAALAFLRRCDSLQAVTLDLLQSHKDALIQSGLKPASVNSHLAAVKSLLSFAHTAGYLPVNVGRAVRLLKLRDDLSARILDAADVHRMIALEPSPRNAALLMLAYYSGARVAELVALTWRDLQARGDAGQVTLYGKGSKTRVVRLPVRVWCCVQALRAGAPDTAPVFVSRKGGALDTAQVWRIIRAAALRAGVQAEVSPHWLRHAHASHALDAGCPVHTLRESLGHASLATTSRYAHARPSSSSSDWLQ